MEGVSDYVVELHGGEGAIIRGCSSPRAAACMYMARMSAGDVTLTMKVIDINTVSGVATRYKVIVSCDFKEEQCA